MVCPCAAIFTSAITHLRRHLLRPESKRMKQVCEGLGRDHYQGLRSCLRGGRYGGRASSSEDPLLRLALYSASQAEPSLQCPAAEPLGSTERFEQEFQNLDVSLRVGEC